MRTVAAADSQTDRLADEPAQSPAADDGSPVDAATAEHHEPKVRQIVPPRRNADGVVVHAAPVATPAPAAVTAPASADDDGELIPRAGRERGPSWVDRAEAFLSRLSARDNFWNRVFSLLFLPLAFWSGIKMRKTGEGELGDEGSSFSAILPFRKFNKNWYNAMAGASLLANTEIAGGMYVFGEAGGDYTVVCKNLNYTFLRPCYGPAVYRAQPRENLKSLIAAGGEFNITLDMDIRQLGVKPGEREKRVGRAEITFHVTPKGHAKVRQKKLKQRDRQKAQLQRRSLKARAPASPA